MSLGGKLRSSLIATLFGARAQAGRRRWAELRRKLSGKSHTVHAFLELDDPYSYLLSLYLRDLQDRYDIDLQIHLTQALGEEFRPHADLQTVHAQQDCQRLAGELGVPFLDQGTAPPVEYRLALIETLGAVSGDEFEGEVLEAIGLYWRGDAQAVRRRLPANMAVGMGDAMLSKGQALLKKLGHYNSAMLYYGGEWYWGVDRLHYLTERLDEMELRKQEEPKRQLPDLRQLEQVALPVSPPSSAQDLPPLEFFFSFRSPYSYLAIQRVFDIADAFDLTLNIRPVLPMVMRGLPVPDAKKRYIITDTVREAQRRDITYGKFVDPLGSGVERCLAVFFYALGEKKERAFLLNAARGIWSEGIDVATDKGLRRITGRTGLFWPDVKATIESSDWRIVVEENRSELTDAGFWGVPTLRLGDFAVWGQDRLWLLIREIEEKCDTGEGILI
ncbi:MAG: DsbA family protein [Woeseiaceae bacterium]